MGTISAQEFAIRQPYYPKKSEHDAYYLRMANGLVDAIGATAFGAAQSMAMRKHLAMVLTGYMQDVISDSGLWRSFIDANRQLYGFSLPFHANGEEYVDYELNVEDIRFLVWYDIAMMDRNLRTISPHDEKLMEMADALYTYLDARYDDSPINDDYNIARGLSLTDPNDQEDIFHLAHWLFMYSWLLSPAYSTALAEIAMDPAVREDKEGLVLQQKLDEAISQDTTGPLALFIPEWIYLILKGKLHEENAESAADKIHPFYDAFTKATGGKEIAYFATYEQLNQFFIDGMGWDKGQKHLNQMENEHDFVLLVNRQKGMLLARNVARCIADPENPLYDKTYAEGHALDLLTVRGLCPADLLKYIYANKWLPDAHFPGADNKALVADNWDFIARCYLQFYYTGE